MGVITYTPDSNKIVHVTKVDFAKRILPKTIQLVQYDSVIPVIAVNLYLNDEDYTIPEGVDIDMMVRWSKTGKPFVHKDILGCNASRNIAYVGIDSTMTNEYGEYNPILELVVLEDTVEKRMGSFPFKVIVSKNTIEETEE